MQNQWIIHWKTGWGSSMMASLTHWKGSVKQVALSTLGQTDAAQMIQQTRSADVETGEHTEHHGSTGRERQVLKWQEKKRFMTHACYELTRTYLYKLYERDAEKKGPNATFNIWIEIHFISAWFYCLVSWWWPCSSRAEKERHVRANARDYNDKFSYAVSSPRNDGRLMLVWCRL